MPDDNPQTTVGAEQWAQEHPHDPTPNCPSCNQPWLGVIPGFLNARRQNGGRDIWHCERCDWKEGDPL